MLEKRITRNSKNAKWLSKSNLESVYTMFGRNTEVSVNRLQGLGAISTDSCHLHGLDYAFRDCISDIQNRCLGHF